MGVLMKDQKHGKFFWRQLMHLKYVFNWSTEWSVANGVSISFWLDSLAGCTNLRLETGDWRQVLYSYYIYKLTKSSANSNTSIQQPKKERKKEKKEREERKKEKTWPIIKIKKLTQIIVMLVQSLQLS
jgi:hypothetical protein